MVANSHQERRTAVLEAKYFLIDIHVPPTAVSSHNGHNSYHGVQGVFCPLDWHLQKQNPSAVPMFRDLISSSRHCQQHRIELDLLEIVQQVRHYDTVHATTTHSHHHHQQHHHSPLSTTTTTITPKQLHLAGIVFHETRCGSTLTANLLSAADPIAHRVYSEASPLLTALLTTCTTTTSSSKDCDETKANALLQDVLYLMGRSNDVRETKVFYKIQSVGVRSMSPLVEQQLLPNGVPWIFLYRNSVEVMMSHFKNAAPSIRKNNKATKAVCLRGREQPHPLITDIAKTHNRTLQSLSNTEYCAIHLVSVYIYCCKTTKKWCFLLVYSFLYTHTLSLSISSFLLYIYMYRHLFVRQRFDNTTTKKSEAVDLSITTPCQTFCGKLSSQIILV